MTNATCRANIHNELGDLTRRRNQAAVAGAVARGELKLTTYERLLRLSSRYQTAKREGRVRAARAIKRMAERLNERSK